MKYKVLLVGLGQMGVGYDVGTADHAAILTHARAFSLHPDFELAGGVDPDEANRARFANYYGGWTGSSLADGMQAVQPDVVIIASPTEHHAEGVHTALQHGRPKLILCEKPLAHGLADAQAMVAACREAGCQLYVNYLRRVEPGVLEVRRRLINGAIATPVKGVLWYTKGLLHNGSHFSNLLEFWLGPVDGFRIIDSGRLWGGSDPEPDVQVKFAAGEVTFLAAQEEHFSHYEIQLVTPNGCLRYEQGGAKIIWQPTVPDRDVAVYTVLSAVGETIATEGGRLPWHVADNVSACLRGGPSTLCSGEDALRTLESLLKMKAAL